MQDRLVPARVDPRRVELLQLLADGHDHVRLIESEVDVVMPHEPHRAQGVRVVVREHALAMEGRRHRQAQLLGEAPQGARRPGPGGPRDQPARPADGRRPAPPRPARSALPTAPGRSVCASLNALRTISGTAPGVRTTSAHLVTGENIDTRSTLWWDSL